MHILFSHRLSIIKTLMLISFLVLGACDQAPAPKQDIIQYAKTALPKEPALAEIYQRSCKVCHANSNTQAPLTGDASAWQQRQAKGMDTLLNNVINGYAGMPPLGLCMDCNEAEFIALIEFMSQAP